MFDKNALSLPGSRRVMAVLGLCALADAVLIVGQAWGLARALTNVWLAAGATQAADFANVGTGVASIADIANIAGAMGVASDVVLFALCYVLRHLVYWGRGRYLDRYARRQSRRLRAELMDRLYAEGQPFVQRQGQGFTVTLLVDGVDQVQSYLALIFPKVVDLMVVPTVLTVALFALDGISGIIALVMLPCIIAYMRMLGANAHAAAARQHAEYNRLSNHFVDTMRGISTLKYFGRSKGYAARVYQVSERFREATIDTLKTATLSSLVLDLFRTFALAAVAIMLGFRLMAGWIDLLPALACLIIVPEYFAPVRRYASDFHASLDGANQLASILQALQTPAAPPSDAPAVPRWSADSTLRLDDICFAYPASDEEENGHAALTGISFEARGYQNVGIVGPSGSGKSTLAQLAAGFYRPTSGAITVDGTRLDSLAVPSWLAQVTYIPQNPHIFSATLRENIAFYRPGADDKAIQAAVAAVGLDALVHELPAGLDTPIGQGGRALSGGQAQRVALARALVDDRRIWVLDEPTAHLDIETELELKERMLPCMRDRLVIFATHRKHWLADMDQVITLRDGAVSRGGES